MSHESETISITITRERAAEIVGVSVTRIIRYERLGLVSPRRAARTAMYGPDEMARLRKLRRLTEDLGVNLAGAEIILRLLDRLAELEPNARAVE
jgi:MerR family transcriptional regulator/heat shock protein HspR